MRRRGALASLAGAFLILVSMVGAVIIAGSRVRGGR